MNVFDAVPLPVHGPSFHTDRTRGLYFPASQFVIASGSPDLAMRGSTANVYDKMPMWAFDPTSVEDIATTFVMPADWNAGAVTPSVLYAPATTNVGGILWQWVGAKIASGEQVDLGFIQNVFMNPTTSGVAEELVSVSGAAFTPAAGLLYRLVVRRNPIDAGDTFTGDAWLAGVLLSYTADG